MSNRVLKKLQGEKDLASTLGVDGLSESDDCSTSQAAPSSGGTKKKIMNRFELLNNVEHSFSDTEAKEDDDRELDPPSLTTAVTLEHLQQHSQAPTAERNKLEKQDSTHSTDSLKRKKKKKKKKLRNQRSIEDNLDDGEDEIDASIREVNKMLGEPEHSTSLPPSSSRTWSSKNQAPEKSILSVEHRNLNPDNEMRRIFGAKVIPPEQVKRKSRGRGHSRPSMLFTPRNWPHIGNPGISMNLIETKGDIHYFSFEHNKHYQQVQFQFLEAVESYNPDNIVELLNTYPYHVDALLQLSEICKMGDDLQMAAELIERTLYCFESCFHPLFNVTQGNCRLDYRKAENRTFFLALFKHLNFVGQRGCNRTALEFCKVILGLEPEGDPLCVSLLIDFYAIRSEQYEFLIRMYQEWDSERNLSQLPNFAFSVPMAYFLQAQTDSKSHDNADKMLQRSLIMFPGFLIPLLNKCGVQPDSQVASHAFFGFKASASQSESLEQLITLYIARCHQLWKPKEVLTWLESNVRQVLKRVDAKDPYVAECEEKRKVRYPKTPINIMRHIVISGIKEVTVTLPQDTPMFGFDPLPPADAITTYSRPPRTQTMEDQGVLSMFFRSLLPNFNLDIGSVVANREEAAGAQAAGAEAREPNDIRRSVTSLLDAMRDLLSNIQLADVPNDGDVDSDEEQE